MMQRMNSRIRFLGMVAVLALASGVLTSCSTNAQNPDQTTSPIATPANSSSHADHAGHGDHSMGMDLGPANAEYDLRFVDAMTPHHQGAVEMAQAAQQKSQRPEIQKLANDIISAQDKEIAQMQQWRKTWYPQASAEPVVYDAKTGKSTPMTPGQIQSMMMSGDLGAADAEFDLRFIEAMIPHHQGAIAMAEDALKKAQREEIKQMAKAIVTSQQAEIEQMQQWRKTWYGQ